MSAEIDLWGEPPWLCRDCGHRMFDAVDATDDGGDPACSKCGSTRVVRRDDVRLPGLSFWRPWTDAILRGPKRCENRSWAPPKTILGKLIALHATARYDAGDWPMPGGWKPPTKADSRSDDVPRRPCRSSEPRARQRRARSQRCPSASSAKYADRIGTLDRDPWWAGPVGWLLDDVTAIDPVPCKGAQGLWTVPPAIAAEVRKRWDAARAASAA